LFVLFVCFVCVCIVCVCVSEMDAKPAAPESLKQKTAQDAKTEERRKAAAEKRAKAQEAKREQMFKRAEKYQQEYQQAERDLVQQRRVARLNGDFFREPEARLALVVRIRGINQTSPRTRKILRLLRLRQIFNAVFVRLNKATSTMLRLVSPYIAYGYPNLKTVREMIYKRGAGKVDCKRIPLVSNEMIEKALGRYGIICMEDLVHEIYTVGPHFKQANRFLWPFKLNSPRGGLKKKGVSFIEGGDHGNRENKINNLVRRMI